MPTNEPKPTDPLLRAFGHIVQRAAKPEAEKANSGDDDRTFDFIFSTEDEDSYGESVDSASWKLDRYKQNPVILYQHDRGQGWTSAPSESFPIGFASDVRVENKQLVGKVTISRATDLSETVFKLLKEGTLRASSVGFMPGRIEDVLRKDGSIEKTVLYDCELFENSIVMVPANPNAVALSRSKTIAELRARSATPAPSSAAENDMPKKTKAATETPDATPVEAAKTAETPAPEAPAPVEAAATTVEAKAEETATDQPKPLDAACRECMDACKATDAAATACAELAEQSEGDLDALGKEVAEECREASAAAKMAAVACEMLMGAMAGGDAAKAVASIQAKRAEKIKASGYVVGELVTAPDPVRVVALEALGLGKDSTEADVTKAIADLSVKSGRIGDVEPRLRALEAEIAKRDDEQAEREVNWIVKRSADYSLGITESAGIRKALLLRRKHDGKGFAEDYKAALDGLKAFDRHETFVPITAPGGEAAQTPAALGAKTNVSGNDDLERRATEIQEKAAKAGAPILRSVALEIAISG